MEDFQKVYIRKLSPKIEALQAALDALRSGDTEAHASAKRIAHTLKGSGATYGFPNVSTLAEVVEEASGDEIITPLDKLVNYLRFLKSEDEAEQDCILIVDDSEEIIMILSTVLNKQGYEVEVARTGAEAEEKLGNENISLILLDLILPDADGRNLLVKLKAQESTAAIPIIVLSAKDSPQIKAECYALGADNYFEKPVDVGVLTTHLATTLQHSASVREQSTHDEVTGLLKRDSFLNEMQNILSEDPSSVTLLTFALDGFTALGEKFGTNSVDEALKHISRLISKELPPGSPFSRWSGNEFMVVPRGLNTVNVKRLAQGVLSALEENPLKVNNGSKNIILTFSAGIVSGSERNVDGLIQAASQLMYSAKTSGRGQILEEHDEIEKGETTVLLAEDDDLTAEFIKHRLERTGFKIDHFMHGDEAYKHIQSTNYDLIITDVKMPGMDGFELVQRTREDSSNMTTPLIMLTSMGRENDIARGLQLGADDYMLKPFSPVELLARVQRLLK